MGFPISELTKKNMTMADGWKELLVQSHDQSSTLYVIYINIENATGFFYLEIFVKNGHELSTSRYSKSIISVWTMPTHELILQSAAAARIISQLSQPRSCPLNIYTIPLILSNYQLNKCQLSTWSSRQINDLQLATSIQLLLGTNTITHKISIKQINFTFA